MPGLAWPGTLLHTFSKVRFLLAYIIVVLFNKWPVTDCLGSKFTRKHYHDIHLELTWKQVGGGKRVMRCCAAGGIGNTPPGTEWTPTARNNAQSEWRFSCHSKCINRDMGYFKGILTGRDRRGWPKWLQNKYFSALFRDNKTTQMNPTE